VFGDAKADTSAEVLRNWEALKALEKEKKRLAEDKAKADDAQSCWRVCLRRCRR